MRRGKIGYKVIHRGRVHDASDVESVAALINRFYPDRVRVKVRVTLTQDRDLNLSETVMIAEAAARRITHPPAEDDC